MQHGVSAFRAKRLKELFGASRQTLERWRTWWLETFPRVRDPAGHRTRLALHVFGPPGRINVQR
jgi:hypothetical protein